MGDDDTRRALLDLYRQAGGLEIVGEAANDARAIALTVSARPDVVVVEPPMLGLAAVELLNRAGVDEVFTLEARSAGDPVPWDVVLVSGEAPVRATEALIVRVPDLDQPEEEMGSVGNERHQTRVRI